MLRFFFTACFLIGVVVVSVAGFRGSKSTLPPIEIFPDMDHQPKYQPQSESGFDAIGHSARKLVTGTVPLGFNLPGAYLQAGAKNGSLNPAGFTDQPDYFNTGQIGDTYGDGFPLEVNEKLLTRGRERFQINCAVCHGQVGMGNGIAGQYGIAAIASLQDERIRTMPDGQIYSTITNGKNTMGAYGPNIAVEDRWAIIAYIRALQKSQNAPLTSLTEAQQKELQAKP